MKNWYQLTESETLDKLGVTSEGLSSQQADSLLEKHGKNVLEESKKKSVFQVFLSQFADLMVIILIIAAIVSMFSGSVESTIVIFARSRTDCAAMPAAAGVGGERVSS